MNQFVKGLEKSVTLDAIVITLPYGVMTLSSHMEGDFGIFAYIAFAAVEPDYCVLNVPYENHSIDFFSNMINALEGKFGTKINAISISDKKILWSEVRHKSKLSYVRVNVDDVTKVVNKINVSRQIFYNMLSKKSDRLCKELTAELANNPVIL